MSEVRSRSGGVRIAYDDVGQSEPALLCIPGWATSRALFRSLVPRLSANHRLLVMDLRGHGGSESSGDFGNEALVEDALSVVEASGAREVIPVAVSHAGWVAIELRRRLGERVPQLVLMDWLVLDPPPQFLAVLKDLQTDKWRETRDLLFGMWRAGVDSEAVTRFIRDDMGSFGAETWQRAAREIGKAYAKSGSPVQALTTLTPPVPTLHLYAQEGGPEYTLGQQSFASSHPWFQPRRLNARSHFPMLEAPDDVASAIDRFVTEGQMSRHAFQPPQPPA